MVLEDIIMFLLFIIIIFFGYSIFKSLLKRFLPSKIMFNKNIRNFSAVAEEDRITPEMVGLAALAKGTIGMRP